MNFPPVDKIIYHLHNTIQHYAWGMRGAKAFIPRLLGIIPEPETPYAELWLGAHPKAPSLVETVDGQVPLDQWISAYPDDILGPRVLEQFGPALPFLMKVLSASTSLSIQAHPAKHQAEVLHALDPEHYADDNHKPEIAVALDGLDALMGFQPFDGILDTLDAYPELAAFLGEPLLLHVRGAAGSDQETMRDRTQLLFEVLVRRAIAQPDALIAAVDALIARLQVREDEVSQRILDLYARYGSGDVGLLVYLLFNQVHLQPGEAMYTPAGVPHAYLGGNTIECMANSDNVVRVGLTPKFKDADTLLRIVDATPQKPQIMQSAADTRETVYATPAREFELTRWSLVADDSITVSDRDGPAILIVTEGRTQLMWPDGEILMQTGDSVLIPHLLCAYEVRTRGAKTLIFRTRVPIQ
jgi:mannose-6-phosphate isomerase